MLVQNSRYRCSRGDVNIHFRKAVQGFPVLIWMWLMLNAVSGVSRADEWAMTPSISVRGQYDDNINMSVDAPVSVWGGTVSPMLDARKSTATSLLGVSGRLIFDRYSEGERGSTNAQLFTFTGRNDTRLSKFNLTGSYKRDTTIRTTITPAQDDGEDSDGGDDAGDVDENIVQTIVRRGQLRLRPSWTRALTRVTSLRLGYSLNMTTYSDEAGTALVDYGRQGIDAALIHQLSQKDQLTAGAVASYFEAPDRGTETDDYSIYATWGHKYSELLRGELALGLLSATTTVDGDEVASTGLLYEASLSKKARDLTNYRFTLGRRPYPSGRGTLVLSDYLRANMTRAVSPKLSLSAWAYAYRNQTLDFFGPSTDRTYYNIEAGFRWMITRLWSLDSSYRYRWQKFDEDADSATSNAVYLSVNYAWPNIAVSR